MHPINAPDIKNAKLYDDQSIFHLIYDSRAHKLTPIDFEEKHDERDWCGSITRYQKGAGCYHVYDIFHRGPLIISWFLLNDPDSAAREAVNINNQWHQADSDENLVLAGEDIYLGKVKSIKVILVKRNRDPRTLLTIKR